MALSMQYREKMNEIHEKAKDPMTKKLAMNRELVADLKKSLPEEQARQFTRAYNKQAFPEVFNDQKSAEAYLEKAAKLSDLSDEQRQGIETVRAEFQQTYDALSQQMICVLLGS